MIFLVLKNLNSMLYKILKNSNTNISNKIIHKLKILKETKVMIFLGFKVKINNNNIKE